MRRPALPRRARPRAADGQGPGAGRRPVRADRPLPPDRRHLRHRRHGAHVRPVGRPEADALPADDGPGRRPADRVLDAPVPVRRGVHDGHDLRAPPGGQRAERPAGLVLADAVPVHGLDRPDPVRPRRHRPHRLRDPRSQGRGLPRSRRRDVRGLGVRLAAEPPVERPAAPVHVPGPVPARLHRDLRDRRARRATCAARVPGRRGPGRRARPPPAVRPPRRGPGRLHGELGARLRHPPGRRAALPGLRRHPLPARPPLRPLWSARRQDHLRLAVLPRDEGLVRRRLGALELLRLRGEEHLRPVPRPGADHEGHRRRARLRARPLGASDGRRPVELRHADGAHAPAVLHRRLHRLDGGPVLRGLGNHAVPLPRPRPPAPSRPRTPFVGWSTRTTT